MDNKRKQAYLYLLYRVLLEIRSAASFAYGGIWWLSPYVWKNAARRLCHVWILANAYHNLAAYAARDFDGFNEELFWRDVGEHHRETFNQRLAELEQEQSR
jgi:hypothetical protein